MENEYKVILVGDSGVGKTSLIHRYVKDTFSSSTITTIGAAFIPKTVELPDLNRSVLLKIWDTAGQERYRSLAVMHYQDAAAAILVYDITSVESFDSMKIWLRELRQHAPENTQLIIAANKSDMIEREAVDMEMAQDFANKNNAAFKLTSAKTGTGIQGMFMEITNNLVMPEKENQVEEKREAVKLIDEKKKPVKKGCCKQ